MQTSETFYIEYLQAEFSKRKAKNSGYSLRAYARDLEIDSSNLSAILKRKRNLPPARVDQVLAKLELGPKEEMLFRSSVQRQKSTVAELPMPLREKRYLIDELYYRVISEWEYYAYLSLLELDEFIDDDEWVAKKLGIELFRARAVKQHLMDLQMIKFSDGTVKRLAPRLETTEDYKSRALRNSHRQSLEMAQRKLEDEPVELRDFSSLTLPMDPELLPELKSIIRDFQDRLDEFCARSGSKKEVYQLNCQLFPLTKSVAPPKKGGKS